MSDEQRSYVAVYLLLAHLVMRAEANGFNGVDLKSDEGIEALAARYGVESVWLRARLIELGLIQP